MSRTRTLRHTADNEIDCGAENTEQDCGSECEARSRYYDRWGFIIRCFIRLYLVRLEIRGLLLFIQLRF